METVKPHQL